jgi:hypothetical protein
MSAIFWDKPDKGNINQDNNAVEILAGKILADYTQGAYDYKKVYRETCGPSSLESCLEAMGADQRIICGLLQPSDFYTMAMNDRTFIDIPGWEKPVNRYPEAYPMIIKRLYKDRFSARVQKYARNSDKVDLVANSLQAKQTTAILLLDSPGHFIAGLHLEGDTVHYNDSWRRNPWNPSQEHKRTVSIYELAKNLRYGFVEIWEL